MAELSNVNALGEKPGEALSTRPKVSGGFKNLGAAARHKR